MLQKIQLSIFILCLISLNFDLSAQYDFDIIHQVENTDIKSQGKTGTCWSFASISFIESEVMRTSGQSIDLSEMHVVRDVYKDKARNYILRQGKANFSEGSLAHDMLNAGLRQGLVPEQAYSGKKDDNHNHKELFKELKTYLDRIVKEHKIPTDWEANVDSILDKHLLEYSDSFILDEKNYTAKSYYDHLGLNLDKYINLTSFTHHKFDKEFVLEIPDNYSNGSYLNIEIDRLQNMVDAALKEGHSVIWDGDVSEKGFSASRGLAINPIDFDEKCFDQPCKEKSVTQKDRQISFENYSTTDDHLMHMVGIANDESGNKYYIIKNSWGEISDYKGYIMMSESYFRAKTVGVTLNEDFLEATKSEE